MSDNTITLHIVYLGETGSPLQEISSSIARSEIHVLDSKRNLAPHVILRNTVFEHEPADNLIFERKSKKCKGFVPVESVSDFKDLHRSLKVKKTLRINVRRKSQPAPRDVPSSSPGAEAVDQFRRLVSEFQKSEIYELMRSFSSLYTQTMAPDEFMADDASSGDSRDKCENDFSEKTTGHSKENSVVHSGVVCDQCGPQDDSKYISGWRYKCMICDDFDLCSNCYNNQKSSGAHSSQHAMLAIEDSQIFQQFLRTRGNPQVMFNYPMGRCPVKNPYPTAQDEEAVRQKQAEHQILKDQAEKYQELEALVEGDGSKFEKLMDLVLRAQVADKETQNEQAMEADDFEQEVGTPDEPVYHAEPAVVKETSVVKGGLLDTLLVDVVVVPKGKSLSQVLITNKSDRVIECTGLSLSVVNCFDMTVASIPIEKRHGILPNRTAKFNVSVSNTHFKYPFKIVLSSAELAGECSLSLKNMSGQLELASLRATPEEQEQKAESALHASSSSAHSFATASIHSVLLPSMPKEVQSSATIAHESSVTNEDMTMSEEEVEDEDYDLISVTEAEDLESDFEVLRE